MSKPMSGPMPVVKHPLYRRWNHWWQACYNPNSNDYPNHGGRGVKIDPDFHEFWDFVNIIEQRLGYPKPFNFHSKLARKDHHGDYTISNLCWDQSKNIGRRCDRAYKLTYKNKTRSIREWCEITGLNFSTVWCRVQRGWPTAEVLGYKPRKPRKAKKQ